MRKSTLIGIVILFLALMNSITWFVHLQRSRAADYATREMQNIVRSLGMSDLCIATDARYIRHLSVSDPVAPYMNHPGALEHFPSSSLRARPVP